MLFKELHLNMPLLKALEDEGYVTPTPIQQKVIPLMCEGYDIVALAQTGSGKSAAFILPILDYFFAYPRNGKAKIKALILAPTREITLQIAKNFERLSVHLPQKSMWLVSSVEKVLAINCMRYNKVVMLS